MAPSLQREQHTLSFPGVMSCSTQNIEPDVEKQMLKK